MELIQQLIIVAFLVEAIWETLKMTWQEGKANGDRIGALIVGIVLAFTLNIDFFEVVGFTPAINYIGIISSGIIVSRGGNFIHDLLSKVGTKKEVKE